MIDHHLDGLICLTMADVSSASGFNGFGLVAHLDDVSVALVKRTRGKLRVVGVGTKEQALASADDFLEIEDGDELRKVKVVKSPTDRQREALARENKIVVVGS